MKKTILLFFVITFIANAQSQQLSKENSLLNISFGLSSYYNSGSGFKTKIPPLEASYEKMLSESISIGGFIGMYKSEYFYSNSALNYDTTISFNYLNIGVVSNYHFVNTDTFNVYAGARLGYLSAKTKYDDSYPEGSNDLLEALDLGFSTSGVLFGAQIGARYFVSDSFAVNAELGYGIALLRLGITYKL
ncbi:MAG: porin family protein [Flavobacteriaceae bacterium]|nr:porin family protein [Flavobacteriaceae bacterium]